MSESKRTTIYLDSDLHRTLKIKAAETNKSISQLIDDAIRREVAEDNEDLAAFREREKEPTVTFEEVLKELKAHGKSRKLSKVSSKGIGKLSRKRR